MTNAAQAGQDVVKLIGIMSAVLLYAKAIRWAAQKTADASDDYELEIDYDKLLTATAEEVAQRNTALKLHRVTELPKPLAPTWPTPRRQQDEAFMLDSEDNQPLAS